MVVPPGERSQAASLHASCIDPVPTRLSCAVGNAPW
jgi:hypothetical protein